MTNAMGIRQQGFLPTLHMWNQRHGSYPPCSYDISINHIVSSESVAPRLRPRMQSNTNGREDPLYSSITDATAVVCASVCDPASKTKAVTKTSRLPFNHWMSLAQSLWRLLQSNTNGQEDRITSTDVAVYRVFAVFCPQGRHKTSRLSMHHWLSLAQNLWPRLQSDTNVREAPLVPTSQTYFGCLDSVVLCWLG